MLLFIQQLCLFLHSTIYSSKDLTPLAHKVHPMTSELARKIGMRFLQPFVLKSLSKENISDDSLYLPLKDIHIGLTSKSKLEKLLREGDITKQQYTRVLQACQAFYKASLNYVLEKMDSKNEFWIHAVWIDFFERSSAKWSDVHFFIHSYNTVVKFSDSDIEWLFEQFIDFKTLEDEEIDLSEAVLTTYDDGSIEYRMDIIWYLMQP